MTKPYWSHLNTIESRDISGDLIKDLCPRNMYPFTMRLNCIFKAIQSTIVTFNIHHMMDIEDGKKRITYNIIDKNNIKNPFTDKTFPVEEIPDSIIINKTSIEDTDMNDNVILHAYTFIMTLKYSDKEHHIAFTYEPDYSNITSNFYMNTVYKMIHDVDKIYDEHLMSQSHFQTNSNLNDDGIISYSHDDNIDTNPDGFTFNFINEIIVTFRIIRDRYLIQNKRYM